MEQKKIDPAQLIPMDLFTGDELRVELAYAGPKSFCGIVYRPGARLWLHEDLAVITVLAARLAWARHRCRLILYDGLRTVTAQAAMLETDIVRAHPQWLAPESRLLSPPGVGGHPRGMAVDVSLETAAGALLDMGTKFDAFPEQGADAAVNRAHRAHPGLPAEIQRNRQWLDAAMGDAAAHFKRALLPLSVEWWDFRFPHDDTERFAPLADTDLPPQMRMTDRHLNAPGPPDFRAAHFAGKKQNLNLALKQTRLADLD